MSRKGEKQKERNEELVIKIAIGQLIISIITLIKSFF